MSMQCIQVLMKTRLLLQLVAVAFLVLGSLVAAASAMEPVWTYKSDERLLSFASSANGSYTAAGGDSGIVYFLDNDGKLLWKQSIVSQVTGIQLSSDGSLVTAINDRGAVYQFNRTEPVNGSRRPAHGLSGGNSTALPQHPMETEPLSGMNTALSLNSTVLGTLSGTAVSGRWIHDVTMSNDGKIVAASDGFNVFTFDEGEQNLTSPGWPQRPSSPGTGGFWRLGVVKAVGGR